eukprot:INCI13367.1.p1 GENE.INCI13367.1~~INCI13367.1.p1  ORF type:complete len:173 (+),score=17.22 INCI13367.1:218-736(+)
MQAGMQARPPASPTRFWGHPLFAMLIGLAVITFKNVFGAQLYDWYLASANPQLASAGTATATAAASDLIEVHFTAPTSGIADSLATGLVESGLVACAQVVPEVRSVYTWGGKLNHESEELVIAKTLRHHFEAVEKHLTEKHPYDVPQITAAPLIASSAYSAWVSASVTPISR